MGLVKRFGLFIIMNLLIITMVSIILNLLNVRPFLHAYGIDYYALLTFCLVWGMVGSLISLLFSKTMARMLVGVRAVDSSHPLYQKVQHLSTLAGLKNVPELGIFESHLVNAFATGPSRNHSLVAVSSGLLEKLEDKEIDGVLAHELSHITNGDMVTMSLLQGLVNAFVMFLARVFAFFMSSQSRSRNDRGNSFSFFLWVMLFQTLFMSLGFLVLAFFSRRREFAADRGGAKLAGTDSMIAALQKLQMTMERKENPKLESVKMLQINAKPSKWSRLFSTHPSLEKRIAALQGLQDKQMSGNVVF